jgi:hypothetical protein
MRSLQDPRDRESHDVSIIDSDHGKVISSVLSIPQQYIRITDIQIRDEENCLLVFLVGYIYFGMAIVILASIFMPRNKQLSESECLSVYPQPFYIFNARSISRHSEPVKYLEKVMSG